MFKKLLSSIGIITFFSGFLFALPVHHYDITKLTDSDISVVTRGKQYLFRIEAKDINGNIPTSGQQESVVINCGGVSPCNISIDSPADTPLGSGRYTPDPTGVILAIIKFTSAPEGILLTAKNFNTPFITGSTPHHSTKISNSIFF
ncbi:MAG: hypothetical protein ACKVQC_08005 [Elusimicrobiota bacterium]